MSEAPNDLAQDADRKSLRKTGQNRMVHPPALPAFEGSAGYYSHVARGYDAISGYYDVVEVRNPMGQRARGRFHEALFRTFHAGDLVLDIGCGTGIEALALASRGVQIVATDLSEEMVRRVRSKATAAGLVSLDVRRLAARDLGELLKDYGEGSFAGAYSHGGVLNTDPCLAEVAEALGELLRPHGHLLCTVVNKTSLFEVLFYPAVLRPRKAFRRLDNVVPLPVTRKGPMRNYVIPTRFYSPRGFARFFAYSFRVCRLLGLGILLPPWNLADYVDRLTPVVKPFELLEDFLGDKPPFNTWGSLFLIELERLG